jgi:hypothetical protein
MFHLLLLLTFHMDPEREMICNVCIADGALAVDKAVESNGV